MSLGNFIESLSFLQFLVIFSLLCTVNIILIIRSHKRVMRISNGCYKNGGQDIIFLCNMDKEEVIHRLSKERYDDTLYYNFFVKEDKYYMNVEGIKKYGRPLFFAGHFEVKFEYGRRGMYLVISLVNKWQSIYTGGYEVELYEFITNKIDAIPVESVQ